MYQFYNAHQLNQEYRQRKEAKAELRYRLHVAQTAQRPPTFARRIVTILIHAIQKFVRQAVPPRLSPGASDWDTVEGRR